MKLFVGITDNDWYQFLASRDDVDEVNFWQPSASSQFQALNPGEPFLFKLHSPLNYIVGGGFFSHFSILPCSLAWEAFEFKNGAESLPEMRNRIIKYRRTVQDPMEDFRIGCILLEQPFFLNEDSWIPIPSDWKPNIVRGKGYDIFAEPGLSLWQKVKELIWTSVDWAEHSQEVAELWPRYGKEIPIKPRLGQGAFKVMVTDAYNRSCAISRERALPVLEAAHIRPYAELGPHSVNNGLLLRSDYHKLFDRGYLTITPSLYVEVSRRIKEEFDNGKHYNKLHGKTIQSPSRLIDRPSEEFIQWHNENVFRE
jgi:putative restriction endonuclease